MYKNHVIIRVVSRIVLGCSLFLFLGGCAKPPTEEMDAAAEALIRAENDPDAAAFGETSLNQARDAIFRMRQEANAKRYDAAKAYAAEAVSAAEKAVNDGRAAARRLRDEAEGLIASVQRSLAETEGLLANAKGTGLELDYEVLGQGMEDARGVIEQAKAAAETRPQEALEKGQAARAALSDIRTRISQGSREASSKK